MLCSIMSVPFFLHHGSSELQDHIAKIDRLRKRYEILSVSMSPPEGEEQHSQAYYVIKAAQEREEIQRQGDDLDMKIKKAETEIRHVINSVRVKENVSVDYSRAMENTLQLMNSKNSSFRKMLTKVDQTGEHIWHPGMLE